MIEHCSLCEGNGWVVDGVTVDGDEFVRPCSQCRPALYARWRAGHLEPGHTCEECQVRKPSRAAPKPFKLTENEAPDDIPLEAF